MFAPASKVGCSQTRSFAIMELDLTLLTWAFIGGGLALMLLETLVPGGIAFFLGVGGLVVGGTRTIGLLGDPMTAAVAWIFLSAGLTIALRPS